MSRFIMHTSTEVAGLAFALVLAVFCGTASAADGELTHFACQNGLEVFVKEDHSRKVAALQLWVKVGSAYENDSERGIVTLSNIWRSKEPRSAPWAGCSEVEEIGGQNQCLYELG